MNTVLALKSNSNNDRKHCILQHTGMQHWVPHCSTGSQVMVRIMVPHWPQQLTSNVAAMNALKASPEGNRIVSSNFLFPSAGQRELRSPEKLLHSKRF